MEGATEVLALAGNFDLKAIVGAVVAANASVAGLVVMGAAATMAGIWDKQGISDLGKLVFSMSMPALIFSKVIVQVSVENLKQLWILPVMCVLHITSAYIIFAAINFIFRLKGSDAKAVLGMNMFGNCGSLAIAVMQALCGSEPLKSKMGGTDACNNAGVSYCAFYVIAWNIFIWGVGDAMLFPEVEEEEEQAPTEQLLMNTRISMVSNDTQVGDHAMVTETVREDQGDQRSSVASSPGRKSASVFRSKSSKASHFDLTLTKTAIQEINSRVSPEHQPMTPAVKKRSTADRAASFVKQMSKSPPIRAAAAAIVLGIYAPVKAFLVKAPGATSEPILGFIMVAVNQMGNAQVPVSMVMLSGSGTLRYIESVKKKSMKAIEEQLGHKVEEVEFNFHPVAKILMLFGRLLIMPFVGLFWFKLFVNMGWWPSQPGWDYGMGMLAFITLIEACVPTAQSIVTMFLVHGNVVEGGAIAEQILVQYALSIVFFSLAAAYFECITL